MSGFLGIINLDERPVDRSVLQRMTDFLSFRGPDATGIHFDGPVGLGHTLLRTTDESLDERQPFTRDGQIWIVAHARIDGRDELIQKLDGDGNDLRTLPDVDLLLQAYEKWGEGSVEHLLGDFAFAIWDGPRQRLFCARDHFGVRPFYYALKGRTFIFSNTLNCVRLHPGVSADPNDQAVGDFLLFGLNRDLASTSFADIKRLPPAHTLVLASRQLSVSRYWTLPKGGNIRYGKSEEYVEHFKEVLKSAVEDRLRNNQIAVLMSGGLDSTVVAGVARKSLANRPKPDLRAFTVVYDHLIPDQERHFANSAANGLGIPINYLVADDYRPYDRWNDVRVRGPEPSMDVYYALDTDQYERITAFARIVLTGLGGDPVFRYCFKPHAAALLRNWRPFSALNDIRKYLTLERGVKMMVLPRLRRLRKGSSTASDPYPPWLNPDFERSADLQARWWMMNDAQLEDQPRAEAYKFITDPYWTTLFENTDSGRNHVPLEKRHPFFDLRLINFVWSIPGVPWSIDKTIIRRAANGLLPERVRRRRKTPLAGDTFLAFLQQHPKDDFVEFQPAPELTNYVDTDVFSRFMFRRDDDMAWMNLRPISLNYWLKDLHRPRNASALDRRTT